MVARGVEDLQVTYLSGNPTAPGAPTDDAPVVNAVGQDYNTLTYRVQVTLSARVSAANLQGETVRFNTKAVRGQLTSSISPRAALVAYTRAGGASFWN